MGSNKPRIETPAQVKAFKEDWYAGMPRQALADKYGWSDVQSVTATARRLDLPERSRAGGPVWTPEMLASFRRDWLSGLTLKELAALYGYSSLNAVSRRARDLGLPKRKGGPRDDPRSPGVLRHGEWVTVRGIKVWKEAA